MKNSMRFLFCLILIINSLSTHAQARRKIREGFMHHFKILDSLAVLSATDKVVNCPSSIRFMEEKTGIIAKGDVNYLGKFFCYKEDIFKWHLWYEKRFKR